eukprot:GHVQ01039872.1.p1 GENE.GHVQ01039872.1~~GHVQ01039872.1.p1  ORF type:complete len:115 (-),score=11.91 GHVQ01039872.1:529-873(-)
MLRSSKLIGGRLPRQSTVGCLGCRQVHVGVITAAALVHICYWQLFHVCVCVYERVRGDERVCHERVCVCVCFGESLFGFVASACVCVCACVCVFACVCVCISMYRLISMYCTHT